ncbi:MAG: hypothetical protein N2314_09175, partial [Brevinematales bacterium]|nr:hypothetical protein [Brevinematales bacterium]
MAKIILSIDQGAKNTGCLIGQEGSYFQGVVLTLNEKDLQLSLADRRSKRHQKRNSLRRKLAKRLFKLILKEEFSLDIERIHEKQKEFLYGLLNRRG